MTPDRIMHIEAACRRLVYTYCLLADAGRAQEAAALYEADGALEIGGKRFVGRQAISERLAGAPPDQVSRHVCANLLVEPLSDRAARSTAYLLLFRSTAQFQGEPTLPLLVGQYEDVFASPNGEVWLFRSRRLTVTFRRNG